MKPIDYNEMQKLLTTMHEELEKEYAEKMNRTRLENIYTESIPLLRQQFFTQLLTETLTEDYCTLQMKNLKLNLDYEVFHIITVKIRENDLNDVLSELSIKETIKESLEKITDLYHFGMIDREVFLLCGNKSTILNGLPVLYRRPPSLSNVFSHENILRHQFQRYQFKGTSCPLSAGSRST